ncbi:dihydroxyacetone kinase subunit DhaL [Rubellimicrobium roseum]|uniref:Dihydroxyacetone kinase subunit L n=1 Tax=Rubellimicrobium roseum TaxID=687525 RepID=A0A5C4N306_9RHOB|nr:dihydroxyacetone kinase subunit DhaL [Rubellimicrobium roseum]TNC58966.1 dihydroxyacetone kinase subunit L [Rubellimicrobium roseum]
MSDFTTRDLDALFEALVTKMAEERDHLCRLDGVIGDADHGIAMLQGMTAARDAVVALPEGTLQDKLNAAAKGFLNAVGASSGPLYATAFLRAGKAAGPRAAMPREETPALVAAMAEGIAHRGKAQVGQKTMFDAWAPAAEAAGSDGPLPERLSRIARAAEAGAQGTADLVAQLGRAARLGDRSLGHPDPGAVSAAMIVATMARHFEDPA